MTKPNSHEVRLIHKIVDRAVYLAEEQGHKLSRLSLSLMLHEVHEELPLRLEALVKAAPFDFTHDVFGLWNHYDPVSGEIRDCFLPRYAKLEPEKVT